MAFDHGLETGIPVAEFATRIPWLITQPELFSLIPESRFEVARCGGPSLLTFELMGFKVQFWFDFVSHPAGKLVKLLYFNYKPRSMNRTFRKAGNALYRSIGYPNRVGNIRHGQSWQFGDIRVDNSLITYYPMPERSKTRRAHEFSVSLRYDAW